MQAHEQSVQKNSLLTAMHRFLLAVNNMDQTVMVPSLLRDVPLSGESDSDMYSSYAQLKNLRHEIEWGGARSDDLKRRGETERDDVDLEQLLRFHLKGLHGVLGQLTSQANDLTNRYKQEIGIAGWGQ